MTDPVHSPLQRDLAIAMAAADIAQKQLVSVQIRHRECRTRLHTLGNEVAAARDALRDAAGEGDAKAIEKARQAFKALESEHEIAELEAEGVTHKVAQAERELASRRRNMCLLAVDVCRIAVAELETNARALFSQFAATMHRRHQLAALAANLATEAAGRYTEPVRYTDERSGLLAQGPDDGLIEQLAENRLSQTFSPLGGLEPTPLSELLELELPQSAEAAQ